MEETKTKKKKMAEWGKVRKRIVGGREERNKEIKKNVKRREEKKERWNGERGERMNGG